MPHGAQHGTPAPAGRARPVAEGKEEDTISHFKRASHPPVHPVSEAAGKVGAVAVELRNPSVYNEGKVIHRPEEMQASGRSWWHPLCILIWISSWVLPGLGMFTESYFIFSTGQIKSVWKEAYPTCWKNGKAMVCPQNIECWPDKTFTNWNTTSKTCAAGAVLTSKDTCSPANFAPNTEYCEWRTEVVAASSLSTDTLAVMASRPGVLVQPGDDASTYNIQFMGYPEGDVCTPELIASISYVEFAGIMMGMLLMGFVAFKLGLKWASVTTISIMGVGAVLMVASSGDDLTHLFTMFAACYCVFGFGVGGEYPVAAVGATERNAEEQTASSGGINKSGAVVSKRGMAIQLMFSMQGWGALAGAAIICIVLSGYQAKEVQCDVEGHIETGYDQEALMATWRILYGIGLTFIIYTLCYRLFWVKEPEDRAENMRKLAESEKNDPNHLSFTKKCNLFFKYYSWRLVGTAGGWFLWDVAFYGNKLFTGPIFSALIGSKVALLKQMQYILLNNFIALIGYWFAAATIDAQWMGRIRLQLMGFIFSGILFCVCAGMWHDISADVKLFLYLFCSFWGQFGPNATTYVLPSESFPSEVRTVGHGISAFMGKAGALVATTVFEHISRDMYPHDADTATIIIFWICGGCCIAGGIFTIFFNNNLVDLDLADQEEHWEYLKNGKEHEYTGEAVNPKNLCLVEIWLGYAKHFVPGSMDATLKLEKGAAGGSAASTSSDQEAAPAAAPAAAEAAK